MYASVAQLVEQRTENPRVVGSIPTGGTIYADLAHLVERNLAKVEVAGSSPVIRSKRKSRVCTLLFLFFSERKRGFEARQSLKASSSSPTALVSKSKLNLPKHKIRLAFANFVLCRL